MSEERRLLGALGNLDVLLSSRYWKPRTAKSAAESARARSEGNELYARPRHDERAHAEALRLYTRAAALAPNDSEELGLAYGNRSALLVHLGKYVEAIRDLDRALYLPLSDVHLVKLMCRKVECQAELGMEDARNTCEDTKAVLQDMKASDQTKKNVVVKLVKAIVKLEKGQFSKALEAKPKTELPHADKFARNCSSECPQASRALLICDGGAFPRYGRHIRATRDIGPGEILYVGEPYVAFPMEECVHSNCSHCLRFAWTGLPCEECVHAIYCSEGCREAARRLYHDAECRLVDRAWKSNELMNSGRLMSVRLVIMALREAGSLEKLRKSFDEVDECADYRRKGFSDNLTCFINNHRSAYSLLTHSDKRTKEELQLVSDDSAVLLYLLARYTKLFRKYFDYDKKALARSEDALFIGKLLSHYQHLILINGITVKDMYTCSSTNWSWTAPKERSCTGLYLNPFLSLLNHSCFPNVVKCEMEDHRTILFSIRSISKGEQLFDCYGPMYCEMEKKKRQKLIFRFYFLCDCLACNSNWPIFTDLTRSGLTFSTLYPAEIDATTIAHKKSDAILTFLQKGKINFNNDTVEDLGYAIVLTEKYCVVPNWRHPSLTATLIAVLTELYGYVVNVPVKC